MQAIRSDAPLRRYASSQRVTGSAGQPLPAAIIEVMTPGLRAEPPQRRGRWTITIAMPPVFMALGRADTRSADADGFQEGMDRKRPCRQGGWRLAPAKPDPDHSEEVVLRESSWRRVRSRGDHGVHGTGNLTWYKARTDLKGLWWYGRLLGQCQRQSGICR